VGSDVADWFLRDSATGLSVRRIESDSRVGLSISASDRAKHGGRAFRFAVCRWCPGASVLFVLALAVPTHCARRACHVDAFREEARGAEAEAEVTHWNPLWGPALAVGTYLLSVSIGLLIARCIRLRRKR